MNVYYIAGYPVSDELYHHGIKGQQWGVQNGPPYPLNSNLSERIKAKAENLKKNPIKKESDGKLSIELNEDQKKALKIGAAAIGAMYLEYKYGAVSNGVNIIESTFEGGLPGGIMDGVYRFARSAEGEDATKFSPTERFIKKRNQSSSIDPNTGLYKIEKDHTQDEDMQAVNPSYSPDNPKTSENCGLCSIAYEMRRRGYDVTAGFSDSGTLPQDLRKCFPGVKERTRYGNRVVSALSQEPPMTVKDATKVANSFKRERNTRGIMFVGWGYGRGGHAIAYEVDSNGNLVIYDSQVRKVYKGQSAVNFLSYTSSCETFRLDNRKPNIDYMIKKKLIL